MVSLPTWQYKPHHRRQALSHGRAPSRRHSAVCTLCIYNGVAATLSQVSSTRPLPMKFASPSHLPRCSPNIGTLAYATLRIRHNRTLPRINTGRTCPEGGDVGLLLRACGEVLASQALHLPITQAPGFEQVKHKLLAQCCRIVLRSSGFTHNVQSRLALERLMKCNVTLPTQGLTSARSLL
jgi:hypothetical protein